MKLTALGMGLLAGLFALQAGGPVANAALLTTAPETESFSLAPKTATYFVSNDGLGTIVHTSNGQPSASQLLTFDQFDSGLGTLVGVKLTVLSSFGAVVAVTVQSNDGELTTVFRSTGDAGHTLTSAGLFDLVSVGQQLVASCATTPGSTCFDDTSGGANINAPAGLTLAAALGAFIGTGTFDLNATLTSILTPSITPDNGSAFASDAAFSGSFNATWIGNATLVYTYLTPDSSVPVPLSLYLVVVGLGGIALARWYRG